jgi:hypothetical protein
MATTLTLDQGLDFGRRLPGEAARFERDGDADRRESPASETFPLPADPPQRGEIAGRPARRGLTLDDVIVGVWEGLHAHHTATCPICGGEMLARHGSGPRPVGGRCRSCSATIS